MPQAGAIAAIVGAAAAVAGTAYSISKGSPKYPTVKPPEPPPPAPPPPAAAPEFAPDTAQEEPEAAAKKKRALSYGLEQTLISSPLGASTTSTSGRTILGG